jgi:proline dehydrogenase
MRRTVRRFLPGEEAEDALAVARQLADRGMSSVLSHLGENITERSEAEGITRHYLDVLERIRAENLPTDVSLKLTQLGLDLDTEFCFANVTMLAEHTPADKVLWFDMEQSPYVDVTLDIFRRAYKRHRNIGICVQSYLYRTENDTESLVPMGAPVRLVKGAYSAPREIAFIKKRDVDDNYFRLAQLLLGPEARRAGGRAVFGTHDRLLVARLTEWATQQGVPKNQLEFQMLYGIQRREQQRLAKEGYRSGVFICYGSFWFPWFLRRLAERPANVLFLARNFFPG